MIEPEEIIEAEFVAALAAAVPNLDVIGALSPVFEGETKHAALSGISVYADIASQGLDWKGPGVPCTYAVRIVLRVEEADDKTFALFRDSARRIRSVLSALLGDGCGNLGRDGFACDSFTLDSTATNLEASGEGAAMVKTYNATVAGRYIPPTETTEQEES